MIHFFSFWGMLKISWGARPFSGSLHALLRLGSSLYTRDTLCNTLEITTTEFLFLDSYLILVHSKHYSFNIFIFALCSQLLYIIAYLTYIDKGYKIWIFGVNHFSSVFFRKFPPPLLYPLIQRWFAHFSSLNAFFISSQKVFNCQLISSCSVLTSR